MVRVFSVYQFGGQTIHRIPDDIRASCLIDSNHLALAKFNHVIEIVTLRNSNEDLGNQQIPIEYPNDNDIQTKFAFPTVDEVVEMVFCKFGNYIATIEQKVTNSGNDQTFCRIYTNWPKCASTTPTENDENPPPNNIDVMSFNVTIRARIAGRVTPSTNNANCLEVIEIPMNVLSNSQNQRVYPHKIAVCQQTGTFICARDRYIKLYKFVECTNDSSHFKYIDFMELPFEIQLDFSPIYLSVNEHIIGCGNREYMCMFKMLERGYCNTADSDVLSANSLTTTSELSGIGAMNGSVHHPTSSSAVNEFKRQFNDSMNDETTETTTGSGIFDYKNVSKKFLASIKSNISSTFDYQARDHNEKGRFERNRRSIELKPVFIDNSTPLCTLKHLSATTDDIYKDYVLKLLFQIKQHDAANDPFQCLIMKPIYGKNDSMVFSPRNSVDPDYDSLSNCFKAANGRRFIGISVLLATVNEGYLYQFSNNEKWTINEEDIQTSSLIATYSFTSPIVDVCINDYVIHALSDHGIETYTHRIGHKLFSSSYEYSLRDDPCIIEASPRVDEQICLIGLRPFLGIQKMFCTPQNLILLAKSNDSPTNNGIKSTKNQTKKRQSVESTANWTLYDLKIAQADVLYKDFMDLATEHKSDFKELMTGQNADKVKIYGLLLSEAHVILRIAKEICFDGQLNDTSSNSKHLGNPTPEYIEKLFFESCLQLADSYVIAPSRDQYCLAYPYYLMSQKSIEQVFNRISMLTANIPNDSQHMKGSVHTLKVMITKSTDNSEELGRRLSSAYSTCHTFGEKLLEFLAKYAPNEIAVLGLTSPIFRELMSTKICDVIQQTKQVNSQLTNEEKLCLILNAISSDQQNHVTQLLTELNSIDLYRLLVAHWPILFETTKIKRTGKSMTTFSDLMESHLLPASIKNPSIRLALLATLRNLLIETNVLNIELILKLFMDYLAAHFGQMDVYASVQSILENILEAYFHRLYVIRGYSDSLSSTSHSHDGFMKNGSNKFDEYRTNGQFKSNTLSNNNNISNNNNNNNNNNDSLCSQASTSSDKSNLSITYGNTNSDNSSYDIKVTKRLNGGANGGAGSSLSYHKSCETPTVTANGTVGDDTAQKQSHLLFGSSFNTEALKILIRIYLSALKSYSNGGDRDSDSEMGPIAKSIQLKYVKFLRENFNKIYANHVSALNEFRHSGDFFNDCPKHNFERMVAINDKDNEIRLPKTPILFSSQRLNYLNCMPPIGDNDYFKELLSTTNWWNFDIDCDTDAQRTAIFTVIKLQSLLSSGKLTRDILQEIIHFMEANYPFIGVESFLTILMPFEICIDYLIETQPDYLLNYAICAINDDQKWQQLLIRITMQCNRITQNRSQEFYETLLKDHLDYLVHTKRLPDILTIFPVKYINECMSNADDAKNDDYENISINQDNGDVISINPPIEVIIESNKKFSLKMGDHAIFTHFLKMAVDLDRSERLSEMIKTTGFQLYNTFISSSIGPYSDATKSNAEH